MNSAMTAASLTGLLALALIVIAMFVLWGQPLGVVAGLGGLALVGTTGHLICRSTR
jgi:hypothetical protein